ncbi:hypothetical protein N7532_010435 [Penicillium argentinense]|uniref:Prenylated Rab acceptor 1 n=1 Tax=Penicillium argentinense TaxID=1131581 RepID=A0A9W9JXN2_9EURO|nr:uncharacterized protein N7532_010435 [Penicillium argentinense]KAJ5085664.1 hypothetical protein N7532_010435 [Penicillium argentinense]
MPRWGRPPGARMGRHNRGRGGWDDVARVEEIDSEEEGDEYERQLMRSGRGYMRQLEYEGRGPRRRPMDYGDLTDETGSVDGGDYDLYDHEDSTVAYAVQLAMRDKEDQLVETALERIRRAQMLGKKNVRLSQRELDALERKRQQTDDPSGARRVKQAGASMNIRPSSKRKTPKVQIPEPGLPYPTGTPDPGWGQGPVAHGRPSSSSSAHRPRTPTTQSLRPQQSNSPLRPTYPAFAERLPPNGRPQTMHQHPMYTRPLPDDPSWAPSYYNPMPMNPYTVEQPPYQPQLPSDLRVGPQSRMSYPAGMSPIQAQYRQSPDGNRPSMGASPTRDGRDPDTESEVSSEEEEIESSEEDEDDNEVQIVQVVERERERPAPLGLQRRTVSGSSSRGGRGGRQHKSR